MKEAESELEGVTWQPQISRMAKALKRPGDEERWNYLARTAIHKNKVGQPSAYSHQLPSLLSSHSLLPGTMRLSAVCWDCSRVLAFRRTRGTAVPLMIH